MPDETIQALNIKPDGVYIDGTLGGGGHAGLIMDRLTTGVLLGIDRDENALASARLHVPGITAVHGNFHDMPAIMEAHGIGKADGVLLDLGVSSHQLDTAERGFSYRFDGPLDMRMNPAENDLTAAEIVNTYSQDALTQIFYQYGEEKYAPRIARAICILRDKCPIETTHDLVSIIEFALPIKAKRRDKHPSMRTFMALRIAVNDELAPLAEALIQIIHRLHTGGRIAVISFHSLEDRIVKHTFRKLAHPCTCPRDIPYCVCGKKPQLRVITRNPIVPGPEELTQNSRANSAKLRVAERL
ncbi:MAG: 16S rRNA (cytosine(1402)-N(4))-methyltransferase RsmH [Defluviitaleaceae bacterium]|nr:16S rRNA (cytosine(1402)-N(4))-methyltransferase RsmH [Defluviitaleaceae bacterium]MCL2238871.1 16S rRNA (cytosine(1402)-N(4))-methyltransferase RsmH [Defluviitaleaceae bacterium]